MIVIHSPNPCICAPRNVSPPDDPVDCCLKLCNISVPATSEEAVGPCGQQGMIDYAELVDGKADYCICEDTPVVFSLLDWDDDFFTDVEITSAGIVKWVTGSPSTVGRHSYIYIKACCGQYSAIASILIGVFDECQCPDCLLCDECNPCDGSCIENLAAITAVTNKNNSKTFLNGN